VRAAFLLGNTVQRHSCDVRIGTANVTPVTSHAIIHPLINRLRSKPRRDMPQYLIVYDIKELDCGTRQRVSRHLRKLRAVKLQQSVWESGKLAELKSLADSIGMAGGKALMLKKRVVHLSQL